MSCAPTASLPASSARRQYGTPLVIAGFEPLDLLQALLMLVRQLNDGRAEVENQFTRAVSAEGNRKARALTEKVFAVRDSFEWRGLGAVPHSALRIRAEFAAYDAERRFALEPRSGLENKACECPAILRGAKSPRDCKLFGNPCSPDNPLGSCMVSSEGACAAWYSYGRQRQAAAAEVAR